MNQHQRKRAVLAALFVLLAFGFATAKEKYEEKFEKTIALPKGGKVQVSNVSGDIRIVTWGENQVKIDALKISVAGSMARAKENARDVEIDVALEDSVLRIETKYPKGPRGWGRDSNDVTVNYQLTIPEEAAVKARNVSGDILAEKIGGAADLSTVSGDILLNKASRGAECGTVSGDIRVSDLNGNVFLKSVSGDVHATNIKGSIEAESVSGDVELTEVSEADRVRTKTVSGGVVYRGKINPAGSYSLSSHSGDVEMAIPADSAFDLEAGTFSGDITTDFEVRVSGKISRKELAGVVNGGGATVKLSSFSGEVRLVGGGIRLKKQ